MLQAQESQEHFHCEKSQNRTGFEPNILSIALFYVRASTPLKTIFYASSNDPILRTETPQTDISKYI